jgi:RNA polymerase sigma-70 factor (ECF subfamily)
MLEERFASEGRSVQFMVLRQFLPGTISSPTYEMAASQLKIGIAGLKSAVHRLRQDFRAELRSSVARTVSTPHEVDEELQHLRNILSGKK